MQWVWYDEEPYEVICPNIADFSFTIDKGTLTAVHKPSQIAAQTPADQGGDPIAAAMQLMLAIGSRLGQHFLFLPPGDLGLTQPVGDGHDITYEDS